MRDMLRGALWIMPSGVIALASIKIAMKNGVVHDFPHQGRAGGSYTKSVRYEGAFVIVIDEWGATTAYPAQDVAEVKTTPERY